MNWRVLPIPDGLVAFAQRNPALLITLSYLTLSVIGLMFSWAYYRRFGINYFVFAEIGDFLLAEVREPMSLVAAAIGCGAIYLIYLYTHWELARVSACPDPGRFRQLYIRMQRRWLASPVLLVIVVLMYMLLFIGIWANYRADFVRADDAATLMLTLSDAEPAPHALIGSSSRFLFLWDQTSEVPVVVPHEAVTSLAFPGANGEEGGR